MVRLFIGLIILISLNFWVGYKNGFRSAALMGIHIAVQICDEVDWATATCIKIEKDELEEMKKGN